MGGENPTEFLNNIRNYERRVHCSMYWSSHRLPMQKGKEGVMDKVFKINCVSALFGKSVDFVGSCKSVEDGILPNIEGISEEIGYWIHNLRSKKIPDRKIYDTLVDVRDSYLKDNNLCVSDFAARKKSVFVYDAVKKSLVDLSFGE